MTFLVNLGVLTLTVLFTQFANILSRPLLITESLALADMIVVLWGGTTRDRSLSDISLRWAWYGARLFKRGHASLLPFSPGVASADPWAVAEARRMAEAALDMGYRPPRFFWKNHRREASRMLPK